MKKKSSMESETIIRRISEHGPIDENGNPMLFPISNAKKRVIFLDSIIHRKARAHKRLGCYGAVILSNDKEQIVAAGKMRDLSEYNLGFSALEAQLELNKTYFLEFLGHPELAFNSVKVVAKRVDGAGYRKIIGVEFLECTLGFKRKLGLFLDQLRNDKDGFGMNEII